MNVKRIFALTAAAMLVAAPAYAAAKATVHMSGKVTGLRDGTLTISAPPFVATSAIAQRHTVSVTTSWASITIPSGTSAVLLVMPAGNANTVQVAGAAADAGSINLGASTGWVFLPLASTATLAAKASATTAVTVWFF